MDFYRRLSPGSLLWDEGNPLSLSPLDKHRSINTNSLITGRLSERERVSNRHLPRFHGREQIFRGIEPVEARYFARITAKRPHIDRNSRDCASERLFQNPDDFNFTGLYLSSDGLFLSLSLSSFLGRKNGINRRAEWRIYDFCSFISSFFFFFGGFRENFYFAAIFTSLYLDVWLSTSLDEFEKWSRKRGWIIKRR